MGTGINKIRKLCSENNLPPPEFKYNDFFTIIFKREITNEGLNEKQALVLQTISKNPGIKANKLSELLTIPVSTLERFILYLIENQLIERKGSKKTGGYYKINL